MGYRFNTPMCQLNWRLIFILKVDLSEIHTSNFFRNKVAGVFIYISNDAVNWLFVKNSVSVESIQKGL
ncbi:hypothetical protein ACFQ4Z_02970 [Oceanobacillus oncorhynchi subsp. oncorhynchi]|uniref:hypothetical protein n=1 Tax=Oceanobacillus oncorhynchi TaxID=545501 RepID=UPI003379D216